MVEKRYVITSCGSTGSTFLARLCTAVGMDTGFKDDKEEVNSGGQGHEKHWERRNRSHLPRVVKNHRMSTEQFVNEHHDEIAEVLIPRRNSKELMAKDPSCRVHLNRLASFKSALEIHGVPYEEFWYPFDHSNEDRCVEVFSRWGADPDRIREEHARLWDPKMVHKYVAV